MNKALYKEIASGLQAYENCVKSNNPFQADNHQDTALNLVKNYMPTGSGIDAGIFLDWESSKPNKLIFTFSYHFMNDNGFYTKWESYKLIVTPSLVSDFDLKITGKDVDGIKEYFYQIFDDALSTIITES